MRIRLNGKSITVRYGPFQTNLGARGVKTTVVHSRSGRRPTTARPATPTKARSDRGTTLALPQKAPNRSSAEARKADMVATSAIVVGVLLLCGEPTSGLILLAIGFALRSWAGRLDRGAEGQGQRPAASAGRGQAVWIDPGAEFHVAGRAIPGGGVYVGKDAAAVDRTLVEPSLIDPSLAVDWRAPDWSGSALGYAPRYAMLSPSARAAYLGWLASSREDPRTPIGYVFLYFYGLERRVLHDLAGAPDHRDLAWAEGEVRRLLAVYANGSFQSYGDRFLQVLEVLRASLAAPSLPTAGTRRSFELPIAIRVALGRFAAAGQPIPADWALAWLRAEPGISLRTPAHRCREAFDALFALRYRARYGDGMIVPSPLPRLSVEYRAASPGFSGPFEVAVGSLPDVVSRVELLRGLATLAAECADALDAYSRYLGRHPDDADRPEAAALLPPELLQTHGGAAVERLRNLARTLESCGPAPMALAELVHLWSPEREAHMTKAAAAALAGMLGKVGIGMEPDVRFGASSPASDATVIVFPLRSGAASAPTPEYSAAATLVHLAVAVVAADGAITDDEKRRLVAHLEDVLGLDDSERDRLDAHLRWLLSATTDLGGMKRRIDALTVEQRAEAARALVALAAADGRVAPEEITMLASIYRLIGLNADDVYGALHAHGIADPGPVPVTSQGTADVRWGIPPAADEKPEALTLDYDKIRTRMVETQAVTAMLAEIFASDDDGVHSGVPTAPPSATRPDSPAAGLAVALPGLDAAHAALAVSLVRQPTWERDALEAVVASLGLPMLEAALDRINEAVLDLCGEPLVEDGDPLAVNAFAVQELT